MKLGEANITRNDLPVAKADRCEVVTIDADPSWEGIKTIDCYYFHRMTLYPPVMFEHLAGSGLMQFMDHSDIVFGEDHTVPNVRYVHGKSEVLKGKHTVSTVLLADPCPSEGPSASAWMMYLPDIYRRFLQKFGAPEKSA